MGKLKSIRVGTINWHAPFAEVKGSYYDYVATISSKHRSTHLDILTELYGKGWNRVITFDNSLSIVEKDRHIIRILKLWED